MTAPTLSPNALRVLEARYLLRDATGRVVESPEELFRRVARAVAAGEARVGNPRGAAQWEEVFLELLTSLDFLPNSPTLMNAGTPLGQLSACFVLPVEDDLEAILDAVKHMALIQRSGGGTGFSFSRLRPRGDFLESTGGTASGPVSFMKIFDAVTDHIKQGGKRRGANMGILRADHPDIREFIHVKEDGQALRNFNLSAAAPDRFMRAVEKGEAYSLIHPRTGRETGKVDAQELFGELVQAAWQTGDPGLFFVDTANRANPVPHLGPIEATNPCGEIPLLPYEACTLGSINLAHFVRGREVDWERLRQVTQQALRFLDDAIEVNRFPLPQIEAAVRRTRKVGLGVMGFADLLIQLGIPYDSDEAVARAEEIMQVITETAHAASEALAAERGIFPAWPGSRLEAEGKRRRNATCTAIAPTGTLSIIAGTTPSIEPLFALAYRRNVLEGKPLLEVNPHFEGALRRAGLPVEAILREVEARGTLAGVPDVPAHLRRLFLTALEVPPERHLQIQAAFQAHTDNAVSKTVNLPPTAHPEVVAAIYRRAWRLGLKGITIFRYGSKPAQVMELGSGEEPHHYEHASRCDPEECRI